MEHEEEEKNWNFGLWILVLIFWINFIRVSTRFRSSLILVGDRGCFATTNVVGLLQATTLSRDGFISIIKLTFFLKWVICQMQFTGSYCRNMKEELAITLGNILFNIPFFFRSYFKISLDNFYFPWHFGA